jgi:hypothetical protein
VVPEVCVLDRLEWRGCSASLWLTLLLAALAVCEPSLVRRTLMPPVRATVPINAEPEPVESIATVATEVVVTRVRLRAVTSLTVSRVPYRPESPLAPSWLSSALVSTFASTNRPLRC